LQLWDSESFLQRRLHFHFDVSLNADDPPELVASGRLGGCCGGRLQHCQKLNERAFF
jgi:methionine synthase I (cobalamin-dependent)